MKFFNAEYRRPAGGRERARPWLHDHEWARAPLRRAIAGVIASGGVIWASLVMQVFG
jgi:hypothetical protein